MWMNVTQHVEIAHSSKYLQPARAVPSSTKSPSRLIPASHRKRWGKRRQGRRKTKREGHCGRQVALAHRWCLGEPARMDIGTHKIHTDFTLLCTSPLPRPPETPSCLISTEKGGSLTALWSIPRLRACASLQPPLPALVERQWHHRKQLQRNGLLPLPRTAHAFCDSHKEPLPRVIPKNLLPFYRVSPHTPRSCVWTLHMTFCTAGHFEVTH